MSHNSQFHGSDLEKVSLFYGIPADKIINFGANVNPLGISPKLREQIVKNIDVITKYPDPDYLSLRQCIGNYVGRNSGDIIVGNGSTELISLLLQTIQPKQVLMVGPTYSEYEREIKLFQGRIRNYFLKEENNFEFVFEEFAECIDKTVNMVIICNPNNPTSTSLGKEQMHKIFEYCRKRDILVMIDETYVEFASQIEDTTAISHLDTFDNVLVIRGVSKFYAAPGLRLGYAVSSNKELLSSMNKRKNPWTLNSLAALAGEIMFNDTEYISKTREYINEERNRVCRRLSECSGLKVFNPTANFVLIKLLKEGLTSEDVFEAAIKRGFMIRDCSSFPSLKDKYIRFCFMEKQKNDQLVDVLLSTCGDNNYSN